MNDSFMDKRAFLPVKSDVVFRLFYADERNEEFLISLLKSMLNLPEDDAGVEFSDILEIHTLELGKLPKSTDGTELYDWAKFIDAETEE